MNSKRAAVAAVLCGAALAGCDKGGEAPIVEATGGGAPQLTAQDYFDEYVYPELRSSCATCHQSSDNCTPEFMADEKEQSYETLREHAGLVTHPDNSDLIHHGAHTGPALNESQEELVREWLSLEHPGEPVGSTLVDALVDFGGCMSFDDFMADGLDELAYQQTAEAGPCGSCHKTGEAGTWIGYNAEEMFSKNTKLPWIKRLAKGVFDGEGNLTGLTPSHRFVEKVEFANQCGSVHPSALIAESLENALENFFEATKTRYESGNCDPASAGGGGEGGGGVGGAGGG